MINSLVPIQSQHVAYFNNGMHITSNGVRTNKISNQNKTSSKPEKLKQPAVVVSAPVEEIDLATVLNFNKSRKSEKLVNINDVLKENSAKSAPYRAHPLLHYIKNKNTVDFDRIISFRSNGVSENDTITLILKPAAKAIAGQDGKAIANPLARAVLRQGTNVDVLFEPDAVAIAGPGGTAHAESDLEIHYEDI